MALPPKFAGQLLPTSTQSEVPHTLEIYLDYTCPFSGKLFSTLHPTITSLIRYRYADKLRVIFRAQIQPWHPSSTLCHEAALAVLRLAPARFWDYSAALFERQTEFFDANVVGEGRNETYRRLVRLAEERVGVDAERMMGLLEIKEGQGLNDGNQVTADLKWVIRSARVVGVHVSPTVFFDGVEERAISSAWTVGQWEEWLEKNVT